MRGEIVEMASSTFEEVASLLAPSLLVCRLQAHVDVPLPRLYLINCDVALALARTTKNVRYETRSFKTTRRGCQTALKRRIERSARRLEERYCEQHFRTRQGNQSDLSRGHYLGYVSVLL